MAYKFERLSVLLVEDTEPMRKLLVHVLKTLGVGHIVQANSGKRGFEVFCKEKPDIIICDWLMDDMDGLALVEKIRTDARSPNQLVPIIMITGYSALSRVETARDTGTTEFLVKPFSAADLAKRIGHVISKPRDFVEVGDYFGPDRRRRKNDAYKGPLRRDSDRKNN